MSKVLFIEDDPKLLDVAREKFEREGFTFATAMDGEEGIKQMRLFKPDLVLLDLLMPKVSGFEVLARVKNDPALSKIPIVVLTNVYTDEVDLVKNWHVAHVFLKSNITLRDVVGRVKELLAFSKTAHEDD